MSSNGPQRTTCKCDSGKNEYHEIERKQCTMCNSLLIRRSVSPIRKSVESRLRKLDSFKANPKQSVSYDTILRASSRDHLIEHKMIKSPKKYCFIFLY